MPDHDQFSEGREQAAKNSDEKHILARRQGFYPGPYIYYPIPAERSEELQVILWLLNAAASGVVGNLAYDYLKRLIEKARKAHEGFLSKWKPREDSQHNDKQLFEPEHVTPSPDLRSDLIELADDAIARYRSQNPEWNAGQMRAIDVYLTERKTWAVVMEEGGSKNRILVEIPLIDDDATRFFEVSSGYEGFPVSIWGIDDTFDLLLRLRESKDIEGRAAGH